MKRLSMQIFAALLMFATWLGYSENTLATTTQPSDIQINNVENLDTAIVIPYGDQDNEAGFKPHGTEGNIGTGITSFFVQNNVFYLLDNVNKKVLITDKKGQTSTMKVEEDSFLEDMFVSNKGEIYLLDTRTRVVYQYSKNGILETKLLIPDSLEIPTGIDVNNKNEVIVNQAQEFTVNLSTGEKGTLRPMDDTEVNEVRVNEMEGKIGYKEAGKKIEFTVPFEESFGDITVNSVKRNQIVYTKTEVAADIPKIMAETHVYVVNKKGNVLGSVRVPLEKMYFAPRSLVHVDNNKIYLLSPEKDQVVIYQLNPGKQINKKLKNRIESFKESNKELMLEVERNLNREMPSFFISANQGPNGYIHRGDVNSRAQQMINHQWTLYATNKPSTPVSGTVLPSYVKNGTTGATLTGIPYKWGGGDGVSFSVPGRKSFQSHQATDKIQTGDIDFNGTGDPNVTGLDCSGFAGLAWYNNTAKYATSNLDNITHSITKSNLKLMDALNDSGFHVVLYNGSSGPLGIYTKEATTDGGQKAQSYNRTWSWLETTHDFVPIRYDKIVDDGVPLPIS